MRDIGERRRFEIVHLLGKGGFGNVHLAVLRAPGGFEKRVAVKVLHAEEPSAQVLERFRDEARVLGLIRDRAVVSVDPPVRLDGRWAVVMEYVDGASLGRLLKAYRTLPTTVALEIVQEVCRVLDKVWNVQGPEGRPLHLMHRDLKPANLQITRAGEVKLLDFGLAKGDYDAREAETTNQLSGTAGYIAPERFLGQDGARSDVFSMGVVLWKCLVGRAPEVADLTRLREAGAQEDPALLLAARMLEHDPVRRPGPVEVEDQARALRRQLEGPGLREWARQNVPEAVRREGPLDGQVLQEDTSSTVQERSSNSVVAMAGGAALGGAVLGASALSVAGVAAAVAVGLLVVAVGGGWWFMAMEPADAAPAPWTATVTPLDHLPTKARGITLASDENTLAYSLAGDVWWSAHLGRSTPMNLTAEVDGRCYEVRISPDGSRVMFGREDGDVRKVYVAEADGSGIRDLGPGIPGGWLEGGGQVSVIRLQGVTSGGDAASAELFVLDVATGEVVAEHGIIRAEPRHGEGGWLATKRKRSQMLVLAGPDGREVSTDLDAYPVGFVPGVVVAAPYLDRSAPLLALPFDERGEPSGEPYELARLDHAYASDATISPGATRFVMSTTENRRTFRRVRYQGRRSALESVSLPADVQAAWPLDEGGRWLLERSVDGGTYPGVQWSLAERSDDGLLREVDLEAIEEVHRSALAGRVGDQAWFLLERSTGFELVGVSLGDVPRVETRSSLPSTTLLASVSPDGQQVAITHDALDIHVVPITAPGTWGGEPLAHGEATGWSPDGQVLVWDVDAETARLIHPTTGKVEELPLAAKSWSFAPDGGAVVVADEQLHYVSYWHDVYPIAPVGEGASLLGGTADGLTTLVTTDQQPHHYLVELAR